MEFAAFLVLAVGLPTLASVTALVYDVLKVVLQFGFRYVCVAKTVQDNFTVGVIVSYLNKYGRSYGVNDEHYDAQRRYVQPLEKEGVVFSRKLARSYRLYWYKGAAILLQPGVPPRDGDERYHVSASFRFMRGTLDWDQLVVDAAESFDSNHFDKKSQRKRFRIIRYVGGSANREPTPDDDIEKLDPWNDGDLELVKWRAEDIGLPAPEEPLNHLSLGPEALSVIRDVQFWFRNRQWHKERGIPWRRGYLLHGMPGTGKTSLIRAIGEEMDVPIFIFDLASMDNERFLQCWRHSQETTPRIAIFEDFDTVFNLRERTSDHSLSSLLTFDCILNAIDGIERQEGLLLFVTTNRVETIDPALGCPDINGESTRPGRLDVTVELPGLDYEGRLKMSRRILRNEEQAVELAGSTGPIAAALFQEKCARVAKAQLWGD